MNKKKICWITTDCFIDCDLNYFNMHEILKHYDIHWIVLFSRNENMNLTIEFFRFNYKMRNPKNILINIRLGKAIKRQTPDIIYMNDSIYSPWKLPMFYL